MKSKQVLSNGCFLVFLAILLNAFGAHALKAKIHDEHLTADFLLGGQYQIYHGFALILLGLWAERKEKRKFQTIALFFYGGIFFFSGSLYLLAITGNHAFGAVTPVGGLCFLTAWLLWTLE